MKMPKQKRIIRKHSRKFVRAKHQNATKPMHDIIDESVLKEIPPHMLDKIPAGAGLKPSAATLRMQMLQRIAPPYYAMPQAQMQQQQRTADMKNDNDIKEQIINQAKQDAIIEYERKRKLQKEAAKNKREMQTREHDLALEQKQVDHEIKQKDREHALNIKAKELEYKKEQLEQIGSIQDMINKADIAEATVKQLEHDIETLKNHNKYTEHVNRFNNARDEVARLKAERDALKDAISFINSSAKVAEYQKLINEAAKLNSEAVILKHIKDTKTKALITKLENDAMANASSDTILKSKKQQLDATQAELAKQLDAKQELERKLERSKYYIDKDQQLWKHMEDTKLENKELERKIEMNKAHKVNQTAVAAAQQDIINEQQRKELEALKELNAKRDESLKMNAQRNYIDSPTYAFKEQIRAQYVALADVEAKKAKQIQEAAEALTEAKVKQFERLANQQVYEALKSDQEPADVLIDFGNMQPNPQFKKVAYKMAANQTALAKQAEDRYEFLQQWSAALYDSAAPAGEQYREYIAEQDLNPTEMSLTDLEHLYSIVTNGYKQDE